MPQTKKKLVSLGEIEELAATLPSQSAMCKKLNVNPIYISDRRKTDAEFNAAFLRGWTRNPNLTVQAKSAMERHSKTAAKPAAVTASETIPETAATDNSALPVRQPQLSINVREALRLGYSHPTTIARHLSEDVFDVQKTLNALLKEKIVERDFTEETAAYLLTKKGETVNPDREKIKASLVRYPYQTTKNLCFHTLLSIGVVLDELDYLIAHGIAEFEMCEMVRAYYLKENAPKGKLYLSGDEQEPFHY